jgi:glutamate/tyrosine decarboxylase-like PLP-dependent enzyme
MSFINQSLDYTTAEFKNYMDRACGIISDTFSGINERKVFNGKTPAEVQLLFDEDLPKRPGNFDDILSEIEEKVIPNSTFNMSPYFNAYVITPNNQAGIIGEMFAAFLSQNCGKWHLAPSAVEIEKTVIRWIREFLHLPVNQSGILVSGGSMANLTCLSVARYANTPPEARRKGLFGMPPMIIYSSTEVHHCIDKAVDILGLGRDNTRKIRVNDRFEMDIEMLERQIKEDKASGLKPYCVVGSAGTVNTGAIDDFTSINEICRRYNMWFHIDGAYGAPAAGTDLTGHLYKGMDLADSVAVDPHKWFYVPIEAGCALFKDEGLAKAAFSDVPDYLAADKLADDERLDYMEYGVQLSRGFKALKIWTTFKACGAERISEAIKNDILKSRHLKHLVEKHKNFEVMGEGPLSVVCFRFHPCEKGFSETDLDQLNERLLMSIEQDGRTFLTGTKINGRTVLRSCFINHRAELSHVERVFSIIEELSEALIDNAS